jgi:hypothetical protein
MAGERWRADDPTLTINCTRGAKGTKVCLTIVPPGEDDSRTRVVGLVRDKLKALAP